MPTLPTITKHLFSPAFHWDDDLKALWMWMGTTYGWISLNDSFLYIAYASDDQGADFTTTFDVTLKYIAFLSVSQKIENISAANFTGLWAKYINAGDDHNPVTVASGSAAFGSIDANQVLTLTEPTWDALPDKPSIPDPQVGDNTYIGLDDTTDTAYTDKAMYVPMVDDIEENLTLEPTELATLLILDDVDAPTGYVGQKRKALTVKEDESGTEFGSGAVNYGDYLAVTALRTLNATDYTVNCTTGTYTISLPTAVGIEGRIYNIKNSGSGVITVDGDGSETIEGELTQTLYNGDSMQIQSDNSGWVII